MYRTIRLSMIAVFVLANVVVVQWTTPSCAQDTGTSVIRFRVFDSNRPTVELIPRGAIGFLRNLGNNQPEFVPGLKITPAENGFYQIVLPTDRLVEQLVVTIDSSSGTNYNPAVITKVVTIGEMTIYPGASNPGDTFSVQAYNAQLNTYRTVFNQLVDQFGESERQHIRDIMRRQFGAQLQQMSKAESDGRLISFSGQQSNLSRKLLHDVLQLYGLEEPQPPSPDLMPNCQGWCRPSCYGRRWNRCYGR